MDNENKNINLIEGKTAYEELNIDSLEVLAARAKVDVDKEKEKARQQEEEYKAGTLERFWALIKRDVKRFKNEILIIVLYILFAANLMFVVATGIVDFFTIDTTIRVRNQPALVAIESLLPFIVWMWSTKYDAFNYYRIKFFTFAGCVFNWILLSFGCFRIAIMRILRMVFFSVPTSGSLKPIIIVSGYYVFTAAIIVFAFLAVALQVRKGLLEKLMYRKIVRFRIARILPVMPWKRRFAYDMCIVRNLISAKLHRIFEEDRRLHSKGVGSTGGGKTATILTVSYEADLKRKVKNIDYQKKKVRKLIKKQKVQMVCDFEDIDFNIDYFKPHASLNETDQDKVAKILNKLKYTAKNAGMTVMCPNKAFCDELYELVKAKGLRVNRIDPYAATSGVDEDDIIGFSPIYVPLIENESEDDYLFRVFTAAMLYADVNQAIFEMSGKGDPYFIGLNKNLSVTAAVTMIIAYPLVHPGEYATIGHIQDVISDFNIIRPYRDAMIEKFGQKNEVGMVVKTPGNVKVGPNLQFIVDRIDRDFLGPNAPEINKQATGLRNIIDESLTNPYIRKILCAKKTINLDRALEQGELTLVNFEISLGSVSTGFGMFFMLSFIQAVLRRPGTLKTRLPHFFSIDEAPMLFHPRLELCTTLFRQYNTSMLLFMQSLTQYDKNSTTQYLKTVLTGNCAHQIIFGRASKEDMEFYKELSGIDFDVEEVMSVRENALTEENTSQQFTHSSTLEERERISMDDIRYREFLECTVFSAQHSAPMEPFLGKTHFLPKGYDPRMVRYRVNWHQYYDYSLVPQQNDEREVVGYKREGAVTKITDFHVMEESGTEIKIDADTPLFSSGTEDTPKESFQEDDYMSLDEAEGRDAAIYAEEMTESDIVPDVPDNYDNNDDWEAF